MGGLIWLQESEKAWPEELRSKPSSEIVDPERKSKASVSCVVQPLQPLFDFSSSASIVACSELLLGSEDSLATQE